MNDVVVMGNQLNAKVVGALDCLYRVFKMLMWDMAKRVNLSPIQMQFLLFLNNHSREYRRVSYLARDFGLTQATVSDAVRVLVEKGYIRKKPSRRDKRVAILEITRSGKRMIGDIALWKNKLEETMAEFPGDLKGDMFMFLLDYIVTLSDRKVIDAARVCPGCDYFIRDKYPGNYKPHHCTLQDKPLGLTDLQLECENCIPAA